MYVYLPIELQDGIFLHDCYKIRLIQNYQVNIEPSILCKQHNSICIQDNRQTECCKTPFCQKTSQSFLPTRTYKPEILRFSIDHILCIKRLLQSAVNYQLKQHARL